jgi:hypothetical protein
MRNAMWFSVGLVGLSLAMSLLATGCSPEIKSSNPDKTVVSPVAPSATAPQSKAQSAPSKEGSMPDCDDTCQKARQQLAEQGGVSVDAVRVISVEQVTWPDACLGVKVEGMVCAQVLTPGYRIILEVGGVKHEYHTSLRGTIREAAKP